MVAGHLREKNGTFQIVLSFNDALGNRKTKSISTGLPIKGNKKRAEALLMEARQNFDNGVSGDSKNNPENILFTEFMLEWLEMMKNSVEITTYANYAMVIKSRINPYFRDKGLTLSELTPKHIQDYYLYSLNVEKVSANTVIHRHANIRKALQYALKLGLIDFNPADRVERPKKNKYVATTYNEKELENLFSVVKGKRIEFAVTLGAFYGLRRSEIVGIKWNAIDFERKTFTIKHTVTEVMLDGKVTMIDKERTKTKSSHRTLPLVKPFEELLLRMRAEQETNRRVCGSAYCRKYLDYIYVNELGELVRPNFITQNFAIVLANNKLKKIRFHDLRHPYVKHTTKIFSLRLKVFQAQPVPDALRKIRGAFLHLREGGSHNPFLRSCNKKLSPWSIPQSKMSLILYAISMRLSGYTSTLSMRRSVSSVVSPSELKTAFAASCRLSCRACSSCFCFACANTTA